MSRAALFSTVFLLLVSASQVYAQLRLWERDFGTDVYTRVAPAGKVLVGTKQQTFG